MGLRTTLYLSRRQNGKGSIDYITASICASLQIVANVTPMFSSVLDKMSGRYDIETAAKLELLKPIDRMKLLVLFRRLQDAIGIHCVWLDYAGENNCAFYGYDYSGCILEWDFYKEHFESIGHDKAMDCSEY